jgi:hypothetical protein
MPAPPTRARMAFDAGIALFFFGCIAVAVKFVSANAITIGIARLAITVVILFPILLLTGRLKGVTRSDIRPLAVMGLFSRHHPYALILAKDDNETTLSSRPDASRHHNAASCKSWSTAIAGDAGLLSYGTG